MFMILKRKQIMILIGVLLLVVIAYFCAKSNRISDGSSPASSNVSNTADAEANPGEAVFVSSEPDFIVQARNDKELVRSKAIELLADALESSNSSDEFKTNAEAQILEIASNMDNELKSETLLSAKGYDKNVVFISKDSVTVTIDSKGISETDIARIKDIIFEQTGNNNIKIVEVG